MGVYIPGIEMPKDKAVSLIVCSSGNVYTDGLIPVGEAIPVPPHERLGDLDKLESGLWHMAKYQYGDRQQGILGCCETIRLAPTIIPAEEAQV